MSTELRPGDLRQVGIRAVFGDVVAGAGRTSTPVADPRLAALLARGDALVHGERAATWLDGVLTTYDARGPVPAAVTRPPADLDAVAARLVAAANPVVLAGPGVLHAGGEALAGLRRLAGIRSLGVLNTWGAKGVFAWDDPHHLGTVGLQALDFELGGIGHADLVLATGLDDHEAPPARWRRSPAVTVDPADLPALAGLLPTAPDRLIPKPVLWGLLAGVVQEGWADPVPPLQPSQATRAYADALTAEGLVVAAPGLAGFWVARTFPTTTPRSAIVPSAAEPAGLAAAAALAARLRHPRRRLLLALDQPHDAPTVALLALADRLGHGIAVETWGTGGPVLDPRRHAARLASLVRGDRHSRVEVLTTDPAQLPALEAVAGPIVAWT